VPVRLRFDRREAALLLGEALPVGLGQLFWAAGHALPILMTTALVGGDQVAWIGAAVRIVLALHAFVWLYYFALYPRLVSAADTPAVDLRPLLRGAQSRILWLVMPVAVAGSTASGLLSRLVFGSEFTSAGSTLQIALWALPVAAASGVCRFLLIAAGRQRREMAAAAAGVATVTLCGLLLIPRLAAPGAALALVAGGLVHWAVAAGLAWRSISSEPGVAGALLPALAALLALAGARLASGAGPAIATAVGLGLYAAIALGARAWQAKGEPH
jgi:O-antigen/teichoic acid export membrane protein